MNHDFRACLCAFDCNWNPAAAKTSSPAKTPANASSDQTNGTPTYNGSLREYGTKFTRKDVQVGLRWVLRIAFNFSKQHLTLYYTPECKMSPLCEVVLDEDYENRGGRQALRNRDRNDSVL